MNRMYALNSSEEVRSEKWVKKHHESNCPFSDIESLKKELGELGPGFARFETGFGSNFNGPYKKISCLCGKYEILTN